MGGGERPVRLGSPLGDGVGGVREESFVEGVGDAGGEAGS